MDVWVKGVRKVWSGRHGNDVIALETTNHRFPSGRFTCLLGPSGCGKSTLIQIVGGLEPASAGEVIITSPNEDRPQPLGKHSVMMWQGLNLFPWRNVIDTSLSASRCRACRASSATSAPGR